MSSTSPVRQRRPVFLPALLGATAVMAGLFFLGQAGDTIVRYVVAILALIVAVMAVQVGRWPWAVPFVIVAVLWNPVFPLPVDGVLWASLHVLAAATFLAAALLLRVPGEPPQPKPTR